jgi:hypothetical protein
MEKLPYIEIGYPVFLGDGADAFGAVRDIVPDGRPVIVVNIEGAGDVEIPLDAVVKVAAKKVIVDYEQLDEAVHQAIQHTLDAEDFPPNGEGEVELEPASYDDEDQDADERQFVDGPRVESPLDELPGRAEGTPLFIRHPRGGR